MGLSFPSFFSFECFLQSTIYSYYLIFKKNHLNMLYKWVIIASSTNLLDIYCVWDYIRTSVSIGPKGTRSNDSIVWITTKIWGRWSVTSNRIIRCNKHLYFAPVSMLEPVDWCTDWILVTRSCIYVRSYLHSYISTLDENLKHIYIYRHRLWPHEVCSHHGLKINGK